MRRAVFLDRDGVINRERRDYVKSWSEFEFLPGALPALAALNRTGSKVVVVTNQSVVGRGLIGEEDLALIHDRMRAEISMAGGEIETVYSCTHTPDDDCRCRKPGTALLTRAATELGIDLRESVMVGDALTDVAAAQAVGSLPILISRAQENLPRDLIVVDDLEQAVNRISSEAMSLC